ncbi:hypothetical protein [Methylobacterium sp. ID0610]|uniref:hypothetical protein n=1 Tax=Methylobacterium carpenticola TaxID=3344827 RepID=UPI0036A62EAF
MILLSLSLALCAGSASAQTLELDQRLRACLREQAQHGSKDAESAPKKELKRAVGDLLGRCDTEVSAWLRACRTEIAERDCVRSTDARAVAVLQDGKGSGGGGGGH